MKHDEKYLQDQIKGNFNFLIEHDGEYESDLEEEIETIAKKYAEHVVANKQIHDTMLNELNVKNGEAILSLEGGACGLLADSFAAQFKDAGATNYLVIDLSHDDTGPMTITMQRKAGSTPAEKLRALSDENAALVARAAGLERGIESVRVLIDSSDGVAGLHLNGDVASWESLEEGGHFEEWLMGFNNAESVESEESN